LRSLVGFDLYDIELVVLDLPMPRIVGPVGDAKIMYIGFQPLVLAEVAEIFVERIGPDVVAFAIHTQKVFGVVGSVKLEWKDQTT
jgi:hypothetical protein